MAVKKKIPEKRTRKAPGLPAPETPETPESPHVKGLKIILESLKKHHGFKDDSAEVKAIQDLINKHK